MIILPAIDMLDGMCVRLVKGEYGTAHKVAEDPIQTVRNFIECGAEYIHMVDLDGAKHGNANSKNRKIVSEITRMFSVPVELGGGIRTIEDIKETVECGVSRIILGSAAADIEFLKTAVDIYGDKIAVGIDAKDGFAALNGWLTETKLGYIDFAKSVAESGVKNIIFTDISRDGTLNGPNYEMLSALSAAVDVDITASGGIKDIGHIKQLKKMNLYGAICGKSLYAGTLSLREAILC